MTDEEKMKLARECAAKTFDDRARNFLSWSKTERHYANAIRQGERDYYDEVQSALAAINALAPRLEEAEKLLREAGDEIRSELAAKGIYDTPRKMARDLDTADRITAFLKQGEAS